MCARVREEGERRIHRHARQELTQQRARVAACKERKYVQVGGGRWHWEARYGAGAKAAEGRHAGNARRRGGCAHGGEGECDRGASEPSACRMCAATIPDVGAEGCGRACVIMQARGPFRARGAVVVGQCGCAPGGRVCACAIERAECPAGCAQLWWPPAGNARGGGVMKRPGGGSTKLKKDGSSPGSARGESMHVAEMHA